MQVLNWNDKPQVVKGDFAEEIVHKFLEDKGFIVYEPTTDGAHAFDRLAIKNKKQVVICEIKAKAKMKYYNKTGINLKHYEEYLYIQNKHDISVFIFFVDESLGEIYGNFLSVLDDGARNFTIKGGRETLRLFSMDKMRRKLHILNAKQIEFLKKNSTRNYTY